MDSCVHDIDKSEYFVATFNRASIEGPGWKDRAKNALFGSLFLFSSLRRVMPIMKIKGTIFVLGYDDVHAMLANDTVFATPFTNTMAEMDGNGTVSLLGFTHDQNAEYQHNLCQVMRSLPLDMLPDMARDVALQAKDTVEKKNPLDVVGDLLTPITLCVAQKLFGITFKRPTEFHRWTMAMSNYAFSGPNPRDSVRTAAVAASRLVGFELDAAINAPQDCARDKNTVLSRLRSMNNASGAPALDRDQQRATISGLLTGMLPNIPITGYNVLKVLLERKGAMKIAHEAALADNDDLLRRCILEALRFRPIDPGRHRICVAPDSPTLKTGHWRRHALVADQVVYAMTLPAMFDTRRVVRPYDFNPDRPASDNLALGAGKHWCVGAPIALCVLTQALKPLLRQKNLRVAVGAPRSRFFLDFFPENFWLTFDRGAI